MTTPPAPEDPYPLSSQDAQARLVEVVEATDPTSRHALIEAMADALWSSLTDLPETGECECGNLLIPRQQPGSGMSEPDQDREVHEIASYELDYSVGWQVQTCVHPAGQTPTLYTCTERNDQDTVARIMCPACHRLYNYPALWSKQYT